MYYIRRVLLTIMLLNILLLVLYASGSFIWTAATGQPVDDWQYQAVTEVQLETSERILEFVKTGPIYLLILFLLLETCRLIWASDKLGFVVLICISAVLLSVAGPMVGSITDQSYRDPYGFSVGGAKDVNNFRANIAAGCLPQPSDVTYEGLFYDYHFDTGKTATTSATPATATSDTPKLFAPTWSSAVSRNPMTGATEHFLAVGLKSQLGRAEFARKKLNLVVVLDISGSMSSPFNRYYYESSRRRPDMKGESASITKLEAACSSLVAMLEHLRPDDRLGIALFNHRAYLAKPVSLIGQTDLEALKKHILDLETSGATSMEDGLSMGRSMLAPFSFSNPDDFENRIIFMTDAMPNTDDTSESGLLDMTREMAKNRIHLTFVGMGIDFNSQMIKSITQVRGANYYSVHSPDEFRKRLADEFECMVNPMIFDLTLTLKAPECRIVKVIGSPEADMATGRIMQVKTLFPSPTTAEGSRGGIILLQLEKPMTDVNIALTVSYENRAGQTEDLTENFVFTASEPGHYDDKGIRKGILLARYADLLVNAATAKHKRTGPADPENDGSGWSYWERPARALTITSAAHVDLTSFSRHFCQEAAEIDDPTLEKEIRVLDHLGRLLPGRQTEN